MPLITEEDYDLFSQEILKDTTPETDAVNYAKLMKAYENQQKSFNLPLTPKKDKLFLQTQEENKQKLDTVFSGIEGITQLLGEDISYFPTDEDKYREANSLYFSNVYKDFDKQNYENFKGSWAKTKNKDFKTEKELYDDLKNSYSTFNKRNNISQDSLKLGTISYINGEGMADAIRNARAKNPDLDVTEFSKGRMNIKSLYDPYKAEIPQVIENLYNQTIGKETADSKKQLDTFFNKLKKDNPVVQQAVTVAVKTFASKRGETEKTGKSQDSGAIVEAFNNSVKNIFVGGLKGMGTKDIETELEDLKMADKSFNYYSDSEIDSPEKAKEYVTGLLAQKVAQKLKTIDINPFQTGMASTTQVGELLAGKKGFERAVNSTERQLIDNAILETQKDINSSRDIDSILNTVNPSIDYRSGTVQGYLGTMASTIGSSGSLLGLAVVGGIPGTVAAANLYSGLEYTDLRNNYPEMAASDAANISLVSGAVQGALDKLTIVGTSKFFNFKELAKSTFLAKTLATRFALSYGSEFVIEGLQDATTPVVQSIFSALSEDIPDIDFDRELQEWKSTRADVAIGLVPLVIFGAAGSTYSGYLNTVEIGKSLTDENLRNLGFEDDIISNILEAKKTDLNKANDIFQKFYPERNRDISTNRANNSVSAVDAITSPSSIKEKGQRLGVFPVIETVLDDNTGTTKGFRIDGNDFDNSASANAALDTIIEDKIDQIRSKSIKSITDIVSNRFTQDSEYNAEKENELIDFISEINGLSTEDINETNRIFGNPAEQNNLIKTVANGLREDPQTTLDKLVTAISKNIPQSIKNIISSNKALFKASIKDQILNKDSGIAFADKDGIVFKSIDQSQAIEDKILSASQKTALDRISEKVGETVKVAVPSFSDIEGEETTIEGVARIAKAFKDLFGINTVFFSAQSDISAVQGTFDPNTKTIFLYYLCNYKFR